MDSDFDVQYTQSLWVWFNDKNDDRLVVAPVLRPSWVRAQCNYIPIGREMCPAIVLMTAKLIGLIRQIRCERVQGCGWHWRNFFTLVYLFPLRLHYQLFRNRPNLFTETWCCDWTYQREELINFCWWVVTPSTIWIAFSLPSPLENIQF